MPSHRSSGCRLAVLSALWLCASVLTFVPLLSLASAHYRYSAACCSDQDCTPIDPKHVVESDEGFTVTLGPDDHPMLKLAGATGPQTWFIPRKEAQKAIDFDFHACISPTGRFLCFYPRGNGA